MKTGDALQQLCESAIVAILAYKIGGWVGPVAVVLTYVIGFLANLLVRNKTT